MAKLILSVDGVALKEIPLSRERTTIGRKAHNDIQIDNLAVSGEHAAIFTFMKDAFLEDLQSTNGTYVNGRPVKKHVLQDGDIIELAKYRLKFIGDGERKADDEAERTIILNRDVMRAALDTPPPVLMQAPTPPSLTASRPKGQLPLAKLQVLNGGNAGKELDLTKAVTTLGKPGVLVAAIARRPLGYFITHVEGRLRLIVRGKPLEDNRPYALMDHDIIELGGMKMAFCVKE